jgi:1,2-dihydroxy-3-keto-5-methylthiopentene dioxygenase
MSLLRVYPSDADASVYHEHHIWEDITAEAARAGIRVERWEAGAALPPGADQEDVLAAYRTSVDRLSQAAVFVAADVVRVSPDTPGHPEMRRKFLEEHTHAEDEARFFVEGAGLFVIHHGGSVLCVLCVQGDLINVPAGTPHWFDMRLYTSREGWVARFTGSDIASRFPRFGEGGLPG